MYWQWKDVSGEAEICRVLDGIWAEINEMLKELINRNVEVPQATRTALDGAKVLINLCRYHPRLNVDLSPSMVDSVQGFCVGCCGADIVARIICELKTAQDLIMIRAVGVMDESFITGWQRKLEGSWAKVSRNLRKKISGST